MLTLEGRIKGVILEGERGEGRIEGEGNQKSELLITSYYLINTTRFRYLGPQVTHTLTKRERRDV